MRRAWIALTLLITVALLSHDWSGPPSAWWQESFLVSTFSAIRHGDDIPARMADLRDLGFNALESNTPLEYRAADLTKEEHLAVLSACERNDMRYFVTDHDRLTGVAEPSADSIKVLVEDYGDSAGLGGYFVWDEPPLEALPAVKRSSDMLLDKDDRHLPMTGVVPSYGPYHWPNDYPQFAKTFVETVDPEVIAFDYYGVYQDKEPRTLSVGPGLYRDLQLWSDLALQHEKPLWFYASAVSWARIAPPTVATLRFQASTALAYGARGIIWFMARDYTGGVIDFTGGALNASGGRGSLYGALKEVNHWMNDLGPTVLKLRRHKVVFSDPVPPHTEAFSPGFANLQAVSANLFIAEHYSGKQAAAQSDRYLWIVNRDLLQPTDAELSFNCAAQVTSIPLESAAKAAPEFANKHRIHLEAGQGKLLQMIDQPGCTAASIPKG